VIEVGWNVVTLGNFTLSAARALIDVKGIVLIIKSARKSIRVMRMFCTSFLQS
jgi:hypothetical protein